MKKTLPSYLSPSAVAVQKGVSQDTVLRAVYDGELKAIKVEGPHGTTVSIAILPKDAERWVPKSESNKRKTKS